MRTVLLILFLFSFSSGADVHGIYVKFSGRAVRDVVFRDRIHKAFKMKLVSRLNRTSMDFVRGLPKIDSKIFYEDMCKIYLATPVVEHCEPEVTPETADANLFCNPEQLGEKFCGTLSPNPFLTLIRNEPHACTDAIKNCLNSKERSALWAQEMIGSDLVKKEIAAIKAQGQIQLQKVPVGIIDAGIDVNWLKSRLGKKIDKPEGEAEKITDDNHGTKVFSLIEGLNYTSASSLADIRYVSDIRVVGKKKSYEFINEKSPMIVSMSLAVCSNKLNYTNPQCKEEVGKILEDDSAVIQLQHNSVLVVSAGNNFFDPTSEEARISEKVQPHNIVVGGIDARGVPSNYTNMSSVVDIAAPTSTSKYGKESYSLKSDGAGVVAQSGAGFDIDFGGTSAAAPFVTAALSDAMGVLGQLTLNESKSLLKRTAISTLANELLPNTNGAGMLNSYKMFRVALRMKQAGFPNDRQKTFDNKELYDFSKEASNLLEDGRKQIKIGDCNKFKEGFENLRKSFLLNPTDEVRNLLAEIYKSLGLIDVSHFYSIKKKEELFELAIARRGLGLSEGGNYQPMTDTSVERFLSLLPDARNQTNEAAKKYYAYDKYRRLHNEYERRKNQPPLMFDPELARLARVFHRDAAVHAEEMMKITKPSLWGSLFESNNVEYREYKLKFDCHQSLFKQLDANFMALESDVMSAAKVYEDFERSRSSASCKEIYGSNLKDKDFKDRLRERIQSIKDGTRKKVIDEYYARMKYLKDELKKIEGNN